MGTLDRGLRKSAVNRRARRTDAGLKRVAMTTNVWCVFYVTANAASSGETGNKLGVGLSER